MGKLVFEAVQRAPPLADQIYVSLREQLRAGAFATGERLVDASLAKALGVSRSPVREALARLQADGLLETRDGSVQVPVPTITTMEEIFDVRRLIEPPAAARATFAMDSHSHTMLDTAVAQARMAMRGHDETSFLRANYAFRSVWVACVPNPRLRETILRFDDQAGHVRRLTLVLPDARAEAFAIMEEWSGAFKRADCDAAAGHALAFIEAAGRYFREISVRNERGSSS